ncbi:MAG: MATE family efflux transporter [Clostridia bacterium]|nr:MATE family efflux transporter [Clostridia bacterium]
MSSIARTQIRDFTEGGIMGHLLRFGVPILLGNLMMILLNTVDMIVVGQMLGEAGSSAISIGVSVYSFVNVFVNGCAAAAEIQLAHLVGSGRQDRISRFVAGISGFLLAVAAALMLVLIPLNGTVLRLLNTPAESYDAAMAYSMICLIGIIPIFAYHTISAFLRGMGDSRHPLIFITLACGLNIVLDVVFVVFLGMGVAGAAVATVVAQLVSVVFSLRLLYRRREEFGLTFTLRDFLRPERGMIADYLKLAIPLAIKNSAIQLSAMLISSFTNDFGVTVSAFSGIRSTIATTAGLVMNCMGSAGSVILGQNLAAGRIDRVRKTMLYVGAVTMSLALLFSVVFCLFPLEMFGIFTSEEAVLALVIPYLPIAVLSFASSGLRQVTRVLIDGSGNRRINLYIALLDAIVARVGLAFLFGVALDGGYMGFWFGSTLAAYVPILVGVIFYFTGVWKRPVLLGGRTPDAANTAK